mmetsp:Transcript_8630/g.23757  ORF Transcript_8630/g.23757 Transcript_8630/m.23757 type:complete len:204 (+) Transcript_8630:495-1106(+)
MLSTPPPRRRPRAVPATAHAWAATYCRGAPAETGTGAGGLLGPLHHLPTTLVLVRIATHRQTCQPRIQHLVGRTTRLQHPRRWQRRPELPSDSHCGAAEDHPRPNESRPPTCNHLLLELQRAVERIALATRLPPYYSSLQARLCKHPVPSQPIGLTSKWATASPRPGSWIQEHFPSRSPGASPASATAQPQVARPRVLAGSQV